MVTNEDLAAVLFGFQMALPKMPLEEKALLDREHEEPFFEALREAECLTIMDVGLWAKPMRALLAHLVFQYILGLTLNEEQDFPSDLLEGSSEEVWRRPLLVFLAEHRWPSPSEVPWWQCVPQQ